MKPEKDISLAEYTSFQIGGKAKYFVEAKDKKDITEAVRFAKKNKLKFFLLGRGANVLFSDKGYDGLVIKILSFKFQVSGSEITAEAGAPLKALVGLSARASLSGLEWAAGIPASLGGAIFGNAQAFGSNMADVVKEVAALDSKDLKVRKFNNKQCQFSEKESIFKKNKNLIILSAVLRLKKGNKREIEKTAKEHVDLRKQRHPLDFPSAGSVFVNLPGKEPSSYLIEKAGLKGRRVGGAQVSEKHAGFIINTGQASCKDVLDLIKIIKKEVKDKFNISLKEEIQIIK
jgi:UDP-N-acetylmuramate dehydrogenase